MAKNINYNSLVKFIKENLINDKINSTYKEQKTLTGFFGVSSKEKGEVFSFNSSTGSIDCYDKSLTLDIVLTSSKHFGVSEVKISIVNGVVSFKVNNNINLDSVSYIENKPVQTALVMAFLVNDKHYSRLRTNNSVATRESENYVFNFEDDGSLKLSIKQSNGTLQEVESVSMAIRQQLSDNDNESKKTIETVCKKMFGVDNGLTDPTCAKHFYSILGRSVLLMIKNMGESIVKTSDLVEKLKNSDVNIKYEILKNLNWKIKISNGKKEMVDVDQWLERLSEDNRDSVKQQVNTYKDYLNSKYPQVKEILNYMVNDINNNSRLLDEKYKEAVQQKSETITKKKRLTLAQIANIRAQNITENNALNMPFVMNGVPGAYLYPTNHNPYVKTGGNHNHNYDYNYELNILKKSLSGFNQKLSSRTEKKIEEKIMNIEILENELQQIHEKMNAYTQILRSEKNTVMHGKQVSLKDIENLINQYQVSSKQQTKEIVTLTTAFGKIKMLLEKQDMNPISKQNYLYDL